VSEIPKAALDAAAERLRDEHDYDLERASELALTALEAAEEAWPHNPPGHDYASTTASSTQLAGPRPRPYGRSIKRFGFGPPDVSA
jgi:hypothetical protein